MWILGLKGLTLCISCVCNFTPLHTGERTLCVKRIGVLDIRESHLLIRTVVMRFASLKSKVISRKLMMVTI